MACVQPPLPSKKKSERSVCDLPLIIVFKDHVTFSGMCGKWFDWLFPIHHYITEIARFDWLSFSRALQSEPSVQNLSLSFATIIWCEILTMSSCVLCGVDIVKTRIKILLMVEGAILLKFERNCCECKVEINSTYICRNCLCALKKRRALLNNLHEVNSSIQKIPIRNKIHERGISA